MGYSFSITTVFTVTMVKEHGTYGAILMLVVALTSGGIFRIAYDIYKWAAPKLKDKGFDVPQPQDGLSDALKKYLKATKIVDSMPLDEIEKEAAKERAKAIFLKSMGEEIL